MAQEVFSTRQGKYGGDQARLLQQWHHGTEAEKNELRQLMVQSLGKNVTEREIDRFLKKLHAEGCGFVAGTTLILAHYEKNRQQQQLRHDYGIDFYTASGEVNFAELLLHFYSHERYRRHLPLTTRQFPLPYPGVRASDLRVNILRFSQRRGPVIRGQRLHRKNHLAFREQLAQGKLITLTCYLSQMVLLSCQPHLYHDSQINFHTVMLTGYDETEKKFKVSSWGNQYYLADLPFYATYYAY